ncbi:FxSxx-COOH system tetratricopeptide repeat protein [Streptomyces chartreusis]|uniref:FxSxx-COOH system tetratricopeptide repeat protein n=1 Tax=Streptomyces chartreusis TaxID=1969 RepID=UPI003438E636
MTSNDRRQSIEASGDRAIAAQHIGIASSGDHAHIEQHVHHWPDSALHPDAEIAPGVDNIPWADPRHPFVGREEALAQLTAEARADHDGPTVQTIRGLAGVGKSTLALHHAHRHRDQYMLRWWITADSPASVASGLADLAFRLNPAFSTTVRSEDATHWAINWLSAQPDWLLVLDNVEDPAHIRPLLRQSMTGHVLVTTRRDLDRPDSGLCLDLLDDAHSAEVLTALTGHSEAAAELAHELGHLPLALQQAGAYVVQTRGTLSGYLERLRTDPGPLHATVPEGGDPERAVARIWHHTLQAVEERDPWAVQFLRIIAYFAPDDIPRDIIRDEELDPVDVDRALSLLSSYSLITLTPDTVSIHRLLQSVLRAGSSQEADAVRVFATPEDKARADSKLPWRRRQVRRATVRAGAEMRAAGHVLTHFLPVEDAGDPMRWPRWRALLPHAEALFAQAREDQWLLFPELLTATCTHLMSQGLDARARPYAEMLLKASERLYGPDHLPPHLAPVLNLLAMIHRNLGDYPRANELAQRALALCDGQDERMWAETSGALTALATTYRNLGRFEDALRLDWRSVQISLARSGYTPFTSVSLSNLGLSLRGLGRYEEALKVAEQALEISRETLPADHVTNLTNLNNLTIALLDLERHEEAERAGLHALEAAERILDQDHPHFSVALSNLAVVHTRSGRHEEALPIAERAVLLSVRTLGPDHPITLTNVHNLAGIRSELTPGL